MSWRTVVVTGHSKLEYKMGYLICRGETLKKVHLSEVGTLIVESTATSVTAPLLCELIKNKINVVFCDEKHNPFSQLIPLHGSHDAGKKLKAQTEWSDGVRVAVWTEIIRDKIYKQAEFLREIGSDRAELLAGYVSELLPGDSTNREGHAAKVYFGELFGKTFTREDESAFNAALNYGYAIILSAFNRAICACGYNTQLGLFHKNEFNPYNLSCDFMEPFRIIVDREVVKMNLREFGTDEKRILQNLLNLPVFLGGKKYVLGDAIATFCRSVFAALNERNTALMEFYELQIYESNSVF